MKRTMNAVALVLTLGLAWGQFAAAQTATRRSRTATKKTETAVTAEDVKALRDALAAQQQQIEELRKELQQRDDSFRAAQQRLDQAATAAAEAQTKAVAAQTSAEEQKTSYTQLVSDVNAIKGNMTTAALSAQEDQKRVSALEGVVGRFRFNGDIRVRQEDFFGSGAGSCASTVTNCNPRARERIRARFGVDAKLGEDFTAGFYLASGVLTDPTSTNETLTNMFEKKAVGIDRAFVAYNPSYAKWMTLTGGKFAATWIKTNQTFDPDLNPEGFSEKFSFNVSNPFLKNITFTGMQLLYNEVNRPGSASACVPGVFACTNGSSFTGGDSFAVGGQVAAKLQLTKRWSLAPAYTVLNWRNNDVILNASSGVGGPVFAPNGMTNATVTTTSGGVSITRFLSGFLYSDLILDSNVATGFSKLPNWRILVEYLDNLNAADHPLSTTGAVLTNVGSQSHMYRVQTELGQQKKQGDWMLTYSFHRQEQDSAIASFVESDQRAPTNIVQHTFAAMYRVKNNVTLSYTQWIGRTLNSNLQNRVLGPGYTTGQQEDYLKRMQFDVVYSF